MLDPKIEAALNRQINHEMAAAYNYLAMSAWFEHGNLTGFASWMMSQRLEELTHAQKLLQYVLDRGGQIELDAVEKPKNDFADVHEVFALALEMEKENTETINDLYVMANELGDYATQSHLQWFLDEQVEEEKTFDEIKSLLEMAGDDRSALLYLNDKLGARAAAPKPAE
ncbi:MAG: ferritin [Phycisphaera sp.]|nr:ferritin [Phycisphaera sp.]